MPTVYQRLTHYCNEHKDVQLLSIIQRQELGVRILEIWYSQTEIKLPLSKLKRKEPEGVFEVISYPRKFISTIDKAIADYYREHSPPPKKERKRIPIKNKPAYIKNYPKQKRNY